MRTVSLEDAIAAIVAVAPAVRMDTCATDEALGRTLTQPVVSRTALPRTDVAAMDGFAVRIMDTKHASESSPVALRHVGGSFAGQPYTGALSQDEAITIATGASLPAGSDAIVVLEEATHKDDLVEVRAPGTPKHIRRSGEDLQEGLSQLDLGERLTPSRVSLAAAMGHSELPVAKLPSVAIVVTGEEVGHEGEMDGVYDSNGPLLASMLRGLGAEVVHREQVGDSPVALEAALRRTKAINPDLIVSTGGASVGAFDIVRRTMQPIEHGFERTSVKPGGPVMLGQYDGTPWLGLPGTPVAVAVIGGLLVSSWVHAALGRKDPPPWHRRHVAVTLHGVRGAREKTALWLANASSNDEGIVVVSEVGVNGASRFWSLRDANCLIVVKPGEAHAAGETVSVLPMVWNEA